MCLPFEVPWFFAKFDIAKGGASSETKEPKFKNLVHSEQIIVKKNPMLAKLGAFLYRKRYTDGWVIRRTNLLV